VFPAGKNGWPLKSKPLMIEKLVCIQMRWRRLIKPLCHKGYTWFQYDKVNPFMEEKKHDEVSIRICPEGFIFQTFTILSLQKINICVCIYTK
jgi:hypothetical protein